MPFDWSDYYTLATKLSEGSGQAEMRSAISRAYYAAFCKARDFLVLSGETIPRDGTVHQYVWEAFSGDMSSSGHDKTIEEIGKLLRNKRNEADYFANKYISYGEVDLALKRAASIIEDVAKLAP